MPPHGSTLAPPERAAVVARVRRAVARAADGHQVLCREESILIACSGGADSTSLVDALARLAPPRRWRLAVAYVDHGLRQEAAAEALLVRSHADRYGIPFHLVTVRVDGPGSLQDRARRARYQGLRRLAQAIGSSAIACGHTADDQAETVLMRVLSGATPRALRAMSARNGELARPLLRVWRSDTSGYCQALGMEPVVDPSNRDPRFLRTRVRHELIPALEAVFPAARRRLVAVADNQQRLLPGADPIQTNC
jgi:tRNA(Ile)-lysidine synthase